MNTLFKITRLGNGAREWSDASCNICLGCSHDCLYCFAKAMRSRFNKEMRIPGNWSRQQLKEKTQLAADMQQKGVVMFPSTHDITPEFLPEAVTTIGNLLEGNNQVLIVSKPHLSVIRRLCEEFGGQKSRILFRFTIGSTDVALSAFWEPGAPAPAERLRALRYAYDAGFATSVSMEPILGSVVAVVELVNTVSPFVTDTIWIGKMQRVPIKLNSHIAGFTEARELVRVQQADEEILRLVRLLKGHAKVEWKDSIKKVIEKHGKPMEA